MKKVVIMGGGLNQMPLINKCKSEYYTVVCDANKNAMGKDVADEFRCIDISDASKVVEVCREIGAAGVVCNTESLMPCSARVQTELGLVGNTPEAVMNSSDKFLFRQTQERAGVFYPKMQLFSDYETAKAYAAQSKVPLIIKPAESSGSRGVKVITTPEELTREAFDICVSCSRNKKIILEDFVDFSGQTALEAEVFLYEGKIEYVCLFRTLRDKKHNLVPQCYCSDTRVSKETEDRIREDLQKIFTAAGLKWGQYNVELTFTTGGDIFVIEINARQGGMMLPQFVRIYTGIDIDRLLITTAAGDDAYLQQLRATDQVWSRSAIHFRMLADQTGIFHGYHVDGEAKKYFKEEFLYFHEGEKVKLSENGFASIGTLDFVFDSVEQAGEYEELLFDAVRIDIV